MTDKQQLETKYRKQIFNYLVANEEVTIPELADLIDLDGRTLYKFLYKDGTLRIRTLNRVGKFIKYNYDNESMTVDGSDLNR